MMGQSPEREQIGDSVSAEEDWSAVGVAIRSRMSELKLSTARLARETGLSETTIRYIGQTETRHNASALVAISAVLRWRYDHLTNILRREPHKNVRTRPTLLETLEAEIADLKNTVLEIDKKINVLLKHVGSESRTSRDGTERP